MAIRPRLREQLGSVAALRLRVADALSKVADHRAVPALCAAACACRADGSRGEMDTLSLEGPGRSEEGAATAADIRSRVGCSYEPAHRVRREYLTAVGS